MDGEFAGSEPVLAPFSRAEPTPGGGTAVRAAPELGPNVFAVPTEHVRLAVIDLPIASHRHRVAAAPFAVETELAEPLSDAHVALGPEVGPKRYLVGVVRNDLMDEWCEALRLLGRPHARLVPDALCVPLPSEAGAWAVRETPGRALVRDYEGGGFALPAAALQAAWEAAGRPNIESHGGPTADRLAIRRAPEGATAPPDALAAGFDLRQGIHAAQRGGGGQALRAAAAILVAGLALHGALAAADLWRLRDIAAERRDEARGLLAGIAPAARPGDDPAAALLRLGPRGGAAARGRFLPLMAEVSRALADHREGLSVDGLVYGAGGADGGPGGTLALTIAAPDLPALQAIEATLAAAGLAPVLGVATVADGAARARIQLRDPGGAGR